MKKLKYILSVTFILSLIISGCSKKESVKNSSKKTVYTTFFPVYDLTKRIVGNKMNIEMIIKGNQEPHDFELNTKDMTKITKADLIVYNGAHMEGFIDNLKDVSQKKNQFLDLSQGLTLLESEHSSSHDSVNPHTWLSIKNTIIQLDTIYRKVSSIDPENKEIYKKNYEDAVSQFKALDQKFKKELSKVKSKDKYFIVSHAAFNYLAKDYGLKQIAVTGISPEDEPSAKQLKTIADFVKKHRVKTIFFEGKATPKVAQTLAKNTHTKTATLYTMESLNEAEMKKGYLKLMEYNLEQLIQSFNE